MNEKTEDDDHRRKMAQLAQQYHEVRGELQGVIKYMNLEKEIVREDSASIEAYLKVLETQIAAKQALMGKYKESSKKYKQAKADLEALPSVSSAIFSGVITSGQVISIAGILRFSSCTNAINSDKFASLRLTPPTG